MLINLSKESMRREVSTLLMNKKVTYIEFQGDLWVTLPLDFHIPRWLLDFHFPKVTLGISLLF